MEFKINQLILVKVKFIPQIQQIPVQTITVQRTHAAYSAQSTHEHYYGFHYPIIIEDLDGSLLYRSKSSTVNTIIFDSKNISIFPNPANDVINVYYKNQFLQDIQIEIVDVDGKTKFDQYYLGKNNSCSVAISS